MISNCLFYPSPVLEEDLIVYHMTKRIEWIYIKGGPATF